MLWQAMREAGWPIFPILGFGLSALVLSLRHALDPRRGQLPLIAGLSLIVLVFGVLGTALGVMHAIEGVGENPEYRWLVLIGLREALNNLAMAGFLVIGITIFATIGADRLARRTQQ